jgi:hypothetical protein
VADVELAESLPVVGHGAFPHNPALVGRLSLPSAGRKTYSGAGRLRDVETVLQHLEARHDSACDRQDDRELRRSDLAGCLDPGLERTNDRGASVACENVLDIERDVLRQRANIADEIDDGLAAGLTTDPRKRPIITWIWNMRSASNRAAISAGSWPPPILSRRFCAMAMFCSARLASRSI